MASKSNLLPTTDKKKIFIVDDHPLIRQGLTKLIEREDDFNFSGEASDAQEALQKIKKSLPDLVIVDINLKGSSGLDLTTSLISLYPKILILIISMHEETLYVDRVLKAGAKGYLMKEEATTHVVTAIRKVMSGEVYLSEHMKETFLNRMLAGGNPSGGSSPQSLSNRELEVLQLVGQGLSTREISKMLHISIKTVDSHYAKIKIKLNLKNANALIQYAVKWTFVA
jgi:DNA-binding NarL/FixJ family response regulator